MDEDRAAPHPNVPDDMTLDQPPADPATLRAAWAREVYAVAEAFRRTGRHRRLRDVTIALPIDHAAVEAIELACQALTEGDLSPAAAEFDRFLDQLAADPVASARFLTSVRGVARRVGPRR